MIKGTSRWPTLKHHGLGGLELGQLAGIQHGRCGCPPATHQQLAKIAASPVWTLSGARPSHTHLTASSTWNARTGAYSGRRKSFWERLGEVTVGSKRRDPDTLEALIKGTASSR